MEKRLRERAALPISQQGALLDRVLPGNVHLHSAYHRCIALRRDRNSLFIIAWRQCCYPARRAAARHGGGLTGRSPIPKDQLCPSGILTSHAQLALLPAFSCQKRARNCEPALEGALRGTFLTCILPLFLFSLSEYGSFKPRCAARVDVRHTLMPEEHTFDVCESHKNGVRG